MLLFFVSIGIMILSIVASDDFGIIQRESFVLYGDTDNSGNITFRNSIDQYGDDGFKIVQTCPFKRYFT